MSPNWITFVIVFFNKLKVFINIRTSFQSAESCYDIDIQRVDFN